MSNDDPSQNGEKHVGPSRTSPYPISRLSAPHRLVNVALEIEKADAMMGAVVTNKLQVIVDQIRHLQEQAQTILDRAAHDAELHRAQASFKKKPGTVYHLYARADEQLYFSMLSPDDWGEPPHPYRGSYRLEAYMSWTAVEEIADRDEALDFVRRLMPGG